MLLKSLGNREEQGGAWRHAPPHPPTHLAHQPCPAHLRSARCSPAPLPPGWRWRGRCGAALAAAHLVAKGGPPVPAPPLPVPAGAGGRPAGAAGLPPLGVGPARGSARTIRLLLRVPPPVCAGRAAARPPPPAASPPPPAPGRRAAPAGPAPPLAGRLPPPRPPLGVLAGAQPP